MLFLYCLFCKEFPLACFVVAFLYVSNISYSIAVFTEYNLTANTVIFNVRKCFQNSCWVS